jgi:telomere length regulation protein
MEVEKGRQQREKKRKEKVSKDLHKILSDGLFSPLINEFALMMHSMS